MAGQRLFLGETDFQTVKKVQQAVVPPISSINKSVPPELEKIINRTLARDPNVRYQTARELGVDLNKFMFKFGQPVSTFDIATLVTGAMRDRSRMRPQQGSIIDKLIEEALLEFTSLKEDGGSSSQSQHAHLPSSTPLNPDQFVDPTNWANEISIGDMRPGDARSNLPPQTFSEGNLSALEDAEPTPGSPRSPTPVPLAPQLGGPVLPAPMEAAAARAGGPMNAKAIAEGPQRKRGAVVGAVVFVATAAAFAVAWFAHWIHH